ncbi:MAG: protein kinase [Bryobacterales bacterium]|nr:protein kinase [Bryobacterales bacterium]
MTPERRRQIEELYQSARERGRKALASADPDVRAEVERMLAEDSGGKILDEPATLTAVVAPGSQLGPYRVEAPLGAGGMGEVFRAIDTRLGRAVAIKTCREQFSERFHREVRAISSLNHPHICTLYDVGSLPCGAAYIVTELVQGETLGDWLRHSPTLGRRLVVIGQVIEALGAAHKAGIIHRDLKPANIMVRFDGYVKVLDFGLAKRISHSRAHNEEILTAGVSIPGQIVGTPAYMSPEQIRGEEMDGRSDQFALGIILYEAIAGRHPWRQRKSTIDTMHAILHEDPPPLGLPDAGAIERIIRRCLAKTPELRFQSMAELGTALQRADAETMLPPTPSGPSIAVLPFTNMSADKENEYFAEGLAEEIINALANVPGMKVAARTSSFYFKGKDIEFGEIGKRLNVEHILEGSVRKSGSRLRVTAQLVKLSDGFHLWSERYDRDLTDIFVIQDEITQAITTSLRVKLSPDASRVRQYTPNVRAYELYLKARNLWFNGMRPELLPEFRGLLDGAIELDGQFALPHSFLGLYYTMQANIGFRRWQEVIPLAIAAEQAALRVDPSLPEAHALLGCCIGPCELDWERAERHWRLALAREPVSRDVLFWYGNHHVLPLGRIDEALDAMARGLGGDPLNLLYRHHFARGLRLSGRVKEAEAQLREVLEIDADFPHALGTLGSLCAQQGRFEEALTLTEKAHAIIPWSSLTAGLLAAMLGRAGAEDRAAALIDKLKSGAVNGGSGLTIFHAVRGELDRAAEWAEKAIEERDLAFVQNLGPFLRPTPWWPALAQRLNLPL